MKTRLTLFLFIFVALVYSCKKNKTKTASISGTVINKTTKKPVAGLAVSLSSSKDTRGGLIPFGPSMWGKYENIIIRTTSDADGKFSFDNVEIFTHPSYRYQLFTSSNLGLNNGHTDFGDAIIDIDKSNTGKNYELEVCPHIDNLWVQLNKSTPIVYPDTAWIVFTHQYSNLRGSLPLTYTVTSACLKQGFKCYALQSEVMGQWNLAIYKNKGGTSSITKDNLLLNYGDTLTYIFNF